MLVKDWLKKLGGLLMDKFYYVSKRKITNYTVLTCLMVSLFNQLSQKVNSMIHQWCIFVHIKICSINYWQKTQLMTIQSIGFSASQTLRSKTMQKHQKICLISFANKSLLMKNLVHYKIMKKTKILLRTWWKLLRL